MKPSTIIAIFQRGRPRLQRTHVFQGLDQSAGSKRREMFSYLQPDESGLLFYEDGQGNEWLVTDKQILLSDGQILHRYRLSLFEEVEAEGFLDGSVSKKDICNLILFGKGIKIFLPLELNAWPVMLQIFRHLIRMNQDS